LTVLSWKPGKIKAAAISSIGVLPDPRTLDKLPRHEKLQETMMFSDSTKALAALTLAAAACSLLPAQTTTQGAVAGTVEDATGAAIPKAAVTIHNDGTNAEVHLQADDSGYFKAPLLQVGNYTVTFAASGFGDQVEKNVVVVVGQVTTLEPHLAAGGAAETVQVSAASTLLNTESPDFTDTLSQRQIENLPENNRRWSSLALLTPGVVSDSNGYGLVSVRGISPILNNILIDGADDNQAYYAEERGRTREAYSTSEDAVREFAVNSGVYAAEYGRAAGAVINSVTKSGTNQFHGEAYVYDRQSDWAAFTPLSTNTFVTQTPAGGFTTSTVPIKPEDIRKIWGFSVGGPVIKDKVFFFYTYDQHHRIFPGIAKANVPGTFFALPDPATAGSADMVTSPAGVTYTCNVATGYLAPNTGKTAAPSLDAQTCTLAAREGLASYGAGVLAYQDGLAALNTDLGTVPRVGDQEINTPKIDWQINPRNRVAFLYHRLRWDSPGGVQTTSTDDYALDTWGNDFVKLDYGLAKLESQLTPSISNELGYQYSRELDDESQQPYSAYTLNNFVGNAPGSMGNVPEVAIATSNGGFYAGSPYYSYRKALPDERKWQVFDTVYLVRGNHSFKFGYDGVKNADLINNTYESNGEYTYTYTSEYLADQFAKAAGHNVCNSGASASASATSSAVGAFPCFTNFYQGFGNPIFGIQTYDYGVFGQDNWKIMPRLTVQLGLRYDYEFLPYPSPNLTTATNNFTPYPQLNNRPSDKNNFGPRVGFSWDVFGTGETVLRAGYGMFYGRTNNGILLNTLLNTGSPNGQYTTLLKAATGPSFPNLIASGTAPVPSSYFLAKNLQNPMVHEYDAVVQQNLGKGFIFNLSYLGALGRELPNFLDLNLNPVTTNVPITVVDTTGKGPIPNGTVLNVPTYTAYGNTALFGAAATKYQSITEVISNINSSYNALVAEIQNRSFHGLQFDASYTWSHALDFNQNATTTTTGNNWYDPYGNQRQNYGNSNYNVPNRFVGDVVYAFPGVTSGRSYEKYAVNGWQISNNFQMQNGLPYSYNTTSYTSLGLISGLNGSGGATYLPQLGRNTLQLRRDIVDDARLSKAIPFTERYNLELRADLFNVANHENVSAVGTTAYNLGGTAAAPTATYNTTLGIPTSINSSGFLYTPREIQISARFLF
jgi:hypothetical protein